MCILCFQDKSLLEETNFNEFWEKDVSELVRRGDIKPLVEEAVLQVSDWGFNLADLQVQKQHGDTGLLPWLKSLYSLAEREWAGFLGPIHIWQVYICSSSGIFAFVLFQLCGKIIVISNAFFDSYPRIVFFFFFPVKCVMPRSSSNNVDLGLDCL